MKNKQKRIYPTEENPRYGEAFIVDGIQLEDIDHNFTEMFDVVGEQEFTRVSTWEELKRFKKKVSDEVCGKLNPIVYTKFKDVVAIRIKYFGDPVPQVI